MLIHTKISMVEFFSIVKYCVVHVILLTNSMPTDTPAVKIKQKKTKNVELFRLPISSTVTAEVADISLLLPVWYTVSTCQIGEYIFSSKIGKVSVLRSLGTVKKKDNTNVSENETIKQFNDYKNLASCSAEITKTETGTCFKT